MTKLIFLATFLVVYIASTNAQDVRFGVKAGANLSDVASDTYDSKQLISFHLGGVMEALFTEKISLQTEILYSEQGFKTEAVNEKTTYKLSYINVPFMVKYYVAEGFFLEAGPQIGFLNSAKIITESDDNSDTEDIKEGLRSNDVCLNFGVGYQLKNGWNIGARYNWGISNITKDQLNQNLKNRVLQISVGYLF